MYNLSKLINFNIHLLFTDTVTTNPPHTPDTVRGVTTNSPHTSGHPTSARLVTDHTGITNISVSTDATVTKRGGKMTNHHKSEIVTVSIGAV